MSPYFGGQQADQLLAVGPCHVPTSQGPLADEIRLEFSHRPGEPRIVGRHGAVGVLADDDVALLGAQHVHRLGSILHHVVLLPGGVDRLPHGGAEVGRHIDLESEFAGEAHAKQHHGNAADAAAAHAHVRQGRRAQVDALHQRFEHAA